MEIQEIFDYIKDNPESAFFYTPLYYEKAISYFFRKPHIILKAYKPEEIAKLLDDVEIHVNKGFTGYGYIKYEAGYSINNLSIKLQDDKYEYAKFCLFDETNVIKIFSKNFDLGEAEISNALNKYSISNFSLDTDKAAFLKNIDRIKNYIAEGDTYQVNYTIKSKFDFEGDISGLFLKLIFSQSAEYSAFINNDNEYILSLSPELFFEKKQDRIVCKPMKGTAKRGINTEDDLQIKHNLSESIKNRAENVMIVDLLRNDLTKISGDIKVRVPSLFETEKYETLYQMTSTVTGKYREKVKLSKIINCIFPCGSITGAPKIRTMEIINELEKSPRGIYTGALGIVSKEKDIFSVPIRTITVDTKSGKGEMGIGSGIVWDSEPKEEYKETLLKSNFLTNTAEYFYIFETMLVENSSVFMLEEHIDRLKNSAAFFMFYFNEALVRKRISIIIYKEYSLEKYKIRLSLYKWGKINCEMISYKDFAEKGKIAVSDKVVDSNNKFQYFKTSKREAYDSKYKKYSEQGYFDVVFLNERGELTEGAISNIFIRQGKKWFTPELNCGVLNGIYRDYFIRQHPDCIETKLFRDNLAKADEIIMTNSVRKEVKVVYVNQ